MVRSCATGRSIQSRAHGAVSTLAETENDTLTFTMGGKRTVLVPSLR
jgi:hypothetical protein